MLQFICDSLAQGKFLAVATVVSRSGSGPREPGAMLVWPEDGPACGTVGGGTLEAQTLAMAREVLNDGKSRLLAFDLSTGDLSTSGMICGGRVEVLVDRLEGNHPLHVALFKKIAAAVGAGQNVHLLTSITPGTGMEVTTGRGLLCGDDFDAGNLAGAFQDRSRFHMTEATCLLADGASRCLVQCMLPPRCVYIVGAGHVGLALAAVCAIAGLQTVILDDRPDYASRSRFPQAQDIRIIDTYAAALEGRDIRASDAIVIATHSHAFDRDVLLAALGTPAGYIGMIASRRKRDMIYASLLEEGVAKEELARVRSPIGLDIGAQTPGEIAVSIAAELIAVQGRKTSTVSEA